MSPFNPYYPYHPYGRKSKTMSEDLAELSALDPNHTITFYAEENRIILTVTSDGKIIPGPNLSMDEATQQGAKMLAEHYSRYTGQRQMSEDEKYLPASHRIKRQLAELTDTYIADKIEELVKALIEEDRYNRSPDRAED